MRQSDSFNQVRQEKRSLFQTLWNQFLQSPGLVAVLCFLTVAQGFFTLCAGPFAMTLIEKIGRFPDQRPIWSYFLAFACQLLAALPGWVSVAAFWNIRRNGSWKADITPEPKGLVWLKKVNTWVCAFGWVALFVYPAVTIAAGEYLPFSAVEIVFWLFVAMTAILLIRVTLVRVVLRQAGENITCCWTNTKLLPLLVLVLAVIAAGGILYGGFAPVFCLSVSLLAFGYGLLLGSYCLRMRRLDQAFAGLDAKAASRMADPFDDPYNRY